MGDCVILWDNDIGWMEELQRELSKENVAVVEAESAAVFLQETDLMEKIREMILLAARENAMAAVLSASQLEEELAGVSWADEEGKSAGRWQKILKELCESCPVPVLFVAEEYEEGVELEALKAGVSDFFDKKRDTRICVQRILLCGKRRENRNFFLGSAEKVLILDDKKECVVFDGREYMLTHKEYQVFFILFEKKEAVISRQELLTAVWGTDFIKCYRVVDTIVKQLRAKLKDIPYRIYTKYRAGYYLAATAGNSWKQNAYLPPTS